MYNLKRPLGLVIFFIYLVSSVSAQIKLPAIFSDNMVLQQRANAPIWGWASPGEKIVVQGSWMNAKDVIIHADQSGKWIVKIKTPPAGGPYTITLQGDETITLKNVMVGEVWICSGQSNMEMPVKGWGAETPIENSEEEIKKANYPQIRLFTVKREVAIQPKDDVIGEWSVANPHTVADFSATAYFFGRDLYESLNVPIGLIHSSWGGTIAEAWTSGSALRKLGDFDKDLDRIDSLKSHLKEGEAGIDKPNNPSVLYNAMIAPLIPFAIKGAIWYQGESNRGRAAQYEKLFPILIKDWRNRWKEGEFPFYFVQIAPFNYKGDSTAGAALRDAQRKTLSLSNTGMAVTLDIGNVDNIHPANKQEVGRRLSLWALAKTYGKKIPYSGPLYEGMKVKGDKIILSFDEVGEGLITKGGGLESFEIAGEDKQFVPADAAIQGDRVIVFSDQVAHPKAVRFAWRDASEPHLFNAAGLPASSFTTEK